MGLIFLGKCFDFKIFHIYVQTQKTPKNVKKKARDGDRTRKWQFFGFPLFIAIPLFIGIVAIYVIIVNSIKIGVLG